mmetsp:Transcript_5156/g.16613  ORF Transcript_5156/g.16613 Transcript_5156/m.16613 type:complete len:205 (+) Transcript_5156:278-892(+)
MRWRRGAAARGPERDMRRAGLLGASLQDAAPSVGLVPHDRCHHRCAACHGLQRACGRDAAVCDGHAASVWRPRRRRRVAGLLLAGRPLCGCAFHRRNRLGEGRDCGSLHARSAGLSDADAHCSCAAAAARRCRLGVHEQHTRGGHADSHRRSMGAAHAQVFGHLPHAAVLRLHAGRHVHPDWDQHQPDPAVACAEKGPAADHHV